MLVHVIDEEKGGYRPAERAQRIKVRPFPIKIHLLIAFFFETNLLLLIA